MALTILKASKSRTVPARCVFLDVEPMVEVPRQGASVRHHTFGFGAAKCCFLSGGKMVDQESMTFDRPKKFWDWLDSVRCRKSCTWVFAHNLGYDLTLLDFWDQLMRCSDEVVGFVIEDPPTIITLRRGKCLIKLVDVLNYWRLPVYELARVSGQPVGAVGVLGVQDTPAPENAVANVEVISRCVTDLVASVSATKLCSFRPTASGLSWDAWNKSFRTCRVVFVDNQKARQLERACYFGGRSQRFRLGRITEPVSVLDVQSLYPAVMKASQYPRQLINYTEDCTANDLEAALEDFEVCAEVSVARPPQPYPVRSDSGISWSRSDSVYHLCGDELRSALSLGEVTGVLRASVYARDDLFSSFVDHFYREKVEGRAAGDLPREQLAKLMLNSLYGKFAQKGKKWTCRDDIPSQGPYQYWWHHAAGGAAPIRCRSVALRVESQTQGEDPVQTLPAVSSCITANARCVLERLLQIAGSGHVHYCDTDSLHVDGYGHQRLVDSGEVLPGEIGKLRSIASGSSAYYWGHQHYRVGDLYVCGQIKPESIEIADGLYLQESRTGIQMTLEKGLLDLVEVRGTVIDVKGDHYRDRT